MPILPDKKPSRPEPAESLYVKKKNSVWLKFILFLSGLAIICIILYHTGWINVFLNKERAREFLESLGPIAFLGFIILQVAQVVFAPIPGEVTGILGGYFFGLFWGIVLSTIGLTLGSYIAFALSRHFGRPLVEKLVDRAMLDRFDYVLHKKGLAVIFLLFLLPGFPKDYLCFILGLGHLTTLEFLTVSTVGRVFGTILLTLGGGYIRCEQYGRLYILIGIATVIFLVAYFLRHKIESFLKSLHVQNNDVK